MSGIGSTNCFILEVEYYTQNKNLAFRVLLFIYCHEELKNVHLTVVLFMSPKHCVLSNLLIRACWKPSRLTHESLQGSQHQQGKHHDGLLELSHSMWHYQLCWHCPEQHHQAFGITISKCLTRLCVRNFKVFEGITENKKNNVKNNAYHTWISGESFGDMEEDDLMEGLAENAVEPTNEDLDKIEK